MELDTSSCDKEPIHIPGSIQSFGALISFNSQKEIIYRSHNLSDYLDITPDFKLTDLKLNLKNSNFRFKGKGEADLFGKIHKSGDLYILEIERYRNNLANLLLEIQELSHDVQSAVSLQEAFESVAKKMQSITSYERVMIYRFHDDDHGEVIAEAKEDYLDPFLGLHYPASDIPSQARNLFLKTFVRMIPDVSSSSILLEGKGSSTSLDLSLADLRSVSPIHIEYLKNMKVKASLTISIIVEGKLWGLIACHQYSSTSYYGPESRALFEIVGRILSSEIKIRSERELNERRKRVTHFTDLDINNPIADLFSNTQSVLDILEPDVRGAAAFFEGTWYTAGICPNKEELEIIQKFISEKRKQNSIFSTNSLPALIPESISFADKASGVLSISLKKDSQDLLMWFKQEIKQTINWAGNPDKSLHQFDGKIHPRASFDSFLEEVRLKSSRWDQFQCEQALNFRALLLDLILQKSYEDIKTKNLLLEDQKIKSIYNAKMASFGEIATGIAHEVNNPLAILLSSSFCLNQILKKDDLQDEAKPFLTSIVNTTERLSKVISGLTFFSNFAAVKAKSQVDLQSILKEVEVVISPKLKIHHCVFKMNAPEKTTLNCNPVAIAELLINLINNSLEAIKSSKERWIHLDVSTEGSELFLRVTDSGPGIPKEIQEKIMDPFFTTRPAGKGAGLGLAVANLIAKEHGGDLFLDKESLHTSFVVMIPQSGL